MRIPLIAIVSVLLSLPLGSSPASACAPPAEGEPHCCEAPALYTLDVAGHPVSVPDPFWNPAACD
jgi:hypothetical protein